MAAVRGLTAHLTARARVAPGTVRSSDGNDARPPPAEGTGSFYGPDWYYVCVLRLHPNVNGIDGGACVSHARRRHAVRVSRALRPRADGITVGALGLEFVEPMQRLRLTLGDNPFAIRFDVEFDVDLTLRRTGSSANGGPRMTKKGGNAFVAGVGMTKFEKPGRREWDYPDMVRESAGKALEDAGVAYADVEHVCPGWVYGDSTAGQRAVYELGLTGVPIINVNNNCSTGSSSLYLARAPVAGGLADCVLAVGFEKLERASASAAPRSCRCTGEPPDMEPARRVLLVGGGV
jgi:hypothetical protein